MKKLILVALSLIFAVTTLTACLPSGLTKAPERSTSDTSNTPKSSNSDSTDTDAPKVEETKAVASSLSSLTLRVPVSWAEFNISQEASIQIGHIVKEQYLTVIEESAADFGADFNLDQYTQLVTSNYTTSLSAEIPVISEAQIASGVTARQFEISGTVEGIEISYFITCLENGGVYYQVAMWSLPSRYSDAKPLFEEVLNSISFSA